MWKRIRTSNIYLIRISEKREREGSEHNRYLMRSYLRIYQKWWKTLIWRLKHPRESPAGSNKKERIQWAKHSGTADTRHADHLKGVKQKERITFKWITKGKATLSKAIVEGRRSLIHLMFRKESNCPSRILCPGKISSKEGKIKIF